MTKRITEQELNRIIAEKDGHHKAETIKSCGLTEPLKDLVQQRRAGNYE